jgi:prepilin-type N-terminal cleavage/methylation domain-containing protein
MLQRIRAAHRDERGFTLIELMVATAILGVVIAPLGAAFIVTFKTTGDATNRIAASNDAQQLSIYLPPDVQSADDAIVSGFTASTCTGVTASTIKLQLVASSNDADYVDATDFNVVYFVQSAGTSPNITYQLVRKTCVGTTTSTVVGRNLASTTAVTVTRTPTSGALQRVSVLVTEKSSNNDPSYTYTVTAGRRTL